MYLLFYCQKSGNEPDACKNRYSRIRIFTFCLFKAEQYTSCRVQNDGCMSTTAAASTTPVSYTHLTLPTILRV